MKHRVRLLRQARQDLIDAQDWYERCRKGLGKEFRSRVFETIARIERNPRLCPVVLDDPRMAKIERFPYGVLYRSESDVVIIFAVFHLRQDRKNLQSRLN